MGRGKATWGMVHQKAAFPEPLKTHAICLNPFLPARLQSHGMGGTDQQSLCHHA